MEIVIAVILGIGALEGLFLCVGMHTRNRLLKENNLLIDTLQKAKELEENARRKVTGSFQDPLGEKYRKNPTTGLYRPIKPYRGDDDDV